MASTQHFFCSHFLWFCICVYVYDVYWYCLHNRCTVTEEMDLIQRNIFEYVWYVFWKKSFFFPLARFTLFLLLNPVSRQLMLLNGSRYYSKWKNTTLRFTWKILHQIEGVLYPPQTTDQQEDAQFSYVLSMYTWRGARHTGYQTNVL